MKNTENPHPALDLWLKKEYKNNKAFWMDSKNKPGLIGDIAEVVLSQSKST